MGEGGRAGMNEKKQYKHYVARTRLTNDMLCTATANSIKNALNVIYIIKS